MKYLLLISIFFTFGKSATILNGSCVESFYVNNNKIIYTTSNSDTYQIDYSDSLITSLTLNLNKFYFDSNSNSCIPYLGCHNGIRNY
jgi:hypothetical protein